MHKNKKLTIWLVIALILFALLAFASYRKSKATAIELVGDTLDYLPLSKSSISVDFFESKRIVWCFQFSLPNSVDEDIYVYTNLFGNVARTIPKDLENLLRCFERQEFHPYSKEGIEKARQRSKAGKAALRLCK